MKTISKVLGEYAAYHRHPLNRMTHYFGIPLIIFSLLLILSLASFEVAHIRITVADVLVAILLFWYLRLDTQLALISAAFLLPALVLTSLATATLSGSLINGLFASTFIGGWILQFLGHVIEKRRPALADNFMQIFSAPLFLVSELLFSFGLRQQLANQVEVIAQKKEYELNSKDKHAER